VREDLKKDAWSYLRDRDNELKLFRFHFAVQLDYITRKAEVARAFEGEKVEHENERKEDKHAVK